MTTLTESISQIVSLTQDEIIAIEKAHNTSQISKGELFIFVTSSQKITLSEKRGTYIIPIL